MHMTLGPNATPENLREELAKIRVFQEEHNSLSEIEKLNVQNFRLHERIDMICDLTKSRFDAVEDSKVELAKLRRAVFELCDLIPDGVLGGEDSDFKLAKQLATTNRSKLFLQRRRDR